MTTEHLLNEIEQLKLENSELRMCVGIAESFPLKVRMECRKLIKSGNFTRDFISMLHDSADRAMNESASQHLADIKADAILSIENTDLGYGVETSDFSSEWVYSSDDIKDHANKLREGR